MAAPVSWDRVAACSWPSLGHQPIQNPLSPCQTLGSEQACPSIQRGCLSLIYTQALCIKARGMYTLRCIAGLQCCPWAVNLT